MSTITKARPGVQLGGHTDSGSEENVLDSNDSDYEEDESPDMHVRNGANPFA